MQNLLLEYKNKRSDASRYYFQQTQKLVSSSEISSQFPYQNAISKYKHSVLKYSLALYEGRKYLKRNPNFMGEKSVNSLSVWPPLYR